MVAALVLAACPYEASTERDVTLVVRLEVDRRPGATGIVPAPRQLLVGENDAAALGLESATVHHDAGVSFLLVTSLTDTEDTPYSHCFVDEMVIIDDRSGEPDARIPAGTCIEHGKPLEVG